MNRSFGVGIFLLFLAVIVIANSVYVVREDKQVIVTQFGRPIGEPVTTAGLHFKVPFIQKVNLFEKRWLGWDGDANQMPTLDKRFIWVDTFARWRIADPLLFFQRVRDERGAQTRLDDILDGETRKAVANVKLIEVVRSSNREFNIPSEMLASESVQPEDIDIGREKIVNEIQSRASEKTQEFGIELVDVRFKRINYVEEVRRSVYDRMISEREKIRDKLRSEGQGRSAEIRGSKEKELKRIESGAFRTAEEIRGGADSTAARIYSDAYGEDIEFYTFVRTIGAYRATVGSDETMVLSTDGDFYQFLKGTK